MSLFKKLGGSLSHSIAVLTVLLLRMKWMFVVTPFSVNRRIATSASCYGG